MAKTALITGMSGFVGKHLAEYLLGEGVAVYGSGDINDRNDLEETLKAVHPDYIFHLAAASSVAESWKKPQEFMNTNINGTINLFEAIRAVGINPMVQIAGSSEEYGMIYPGELPVTEDNPLRPLSPYAVSKVAQDRLAYQYYQSYGLNIVITRAFNHTGPGRPPNYVLSNFAQQIALIEKEAEPIIRVGNLKVQRDFSDVRDIVRAYLLAVEKGEPGQVYNICSEKSLSLMGVLNKMFSLSSFRVRAEFDKSRMRPSDIEIIRGDCTKFKERTGWKAEIPLEDTLKDLLDYWRNKVQR